MPTVTLVDEAQSSPTSVRRGVEALDGPYPLASPVTMDDFRASEASIREVFDRLRENHPKQALYFPFQLSSSRPVRAFQGYMAD